MIFTACFNAVLSRITWLCDRDRCVLHGVFIASCLLNPFLGYQRLVFVSENETNDYLKAASKLVATRRLLFGSPLRNRKFKIIVKFKCGEISATDKLEKKMYSFAYVYLKPLYSIRNRRTVPNCNRSQYRFPSENVLIKYFNGSQIKLTLN